MAFTSIEMDEIGNREEAIVLFQIYGENAGYQLLGWLMVFVGLIVLNELSRRTKKGGIFFFLIVPAPCAAREFDLRGIAFPPIA